MNCVEFGFLHAEDAEIVVLLAWRRRSLRLPTPQQTIHDFRTAGLGKTCSLLEKVMMVLSLFLSGLPLVLGYGLTSKMCLETVGSFGSIQQV